MGVTTNESTALPRRAIRQHLTPRGRRPGMILDVAGTSRQKMFQGAGRPLHGRALRHTVPDIRLRCDLEGLFALRFRLGRTVLVCGAGPGRSGLGRFALCRHNPRAGRKRTGHERERDQPSQLQRRQTGLELVRTVHRTQYDTPPGPAASTRPAGSGARQVPDRTGGLTVRKRGQARRSIGHTPGLKALPCVGRARPG